MKVLKALALILVFVVLVVAGLGLQVAQGAERSVLRPQFYLDIFKQHGLPALPQRVVAEVLARAPEQELPSQVRQVLAKGLAAAVSPDWVEEQIGYVVTGLLDFVKGGRDKLDVVIELKERKNVFADAVVEELRRLPPAEQWKMVPPEVVASLSKGMSRQELAKTGIPPEVIKKVAQEFLQSANIPDQIDLASQIEIAPEIQHNVARARTVRKYATIVPWVVLLALGGICLLLAGPGGGLKWVGSSMVTGGVALFAALGIGGRFVDRALAEGSEIPGEMAALLGFNPVELALGVRKEFFAVARGVSLAYAAAGVVLIVAGMLASQLTRAKKDRA